MATTNIQNRMTLTDWLDDLCVRFIINLPNEELSEMPRICFQIEEAQWYYEDFIRPLDSTLPSMGLKEFFHWIFRHCPILSHIGEDIAQQAYQQWIVYKQRVPVRGAILLNDRMDKVVLVKGWKKTANWSFPRGKVNKDEDPLECAIRELYEETGFDVREAGLVPDDLEDVKFIDQWMRDQEIRLYVFRNVPEDTIFEPQTRKEISQIKWWKLSELPSWKRRGQRDQGETDAASKANKFYMVAPFLHELKKWVVQQRKKDATKARTINIQQSQPTIAEEDEGVGIHVQHQEHEQKEQRQMQVLETAVPNPDADGTRAIASANVELKRLLNIQGPIPEGTQNQTPSADGTANKGSTLLALLQAGPSGSGPSTSSSMVGAAQAARPLPHTPMDYYYMDPPQPQSPHHHHTQQPPPSFASYPPPPPFPYDPSHDPTFDPKYYQGQGTLNNSNPQGQVQAHETANADLQQPFLNRQHLRNESVPLVHPQPLPPQVQTGLLTHGLNGTPALPGTRVGPMQPPNQGVLQQHAQQYQAQPTWQAPQQRVSPQRMNQQVNYPKKPPPQLNSHSLALLNVFKSDAKPPLPSPTNAKGMSSQNRQQGVPTSQQAPQQYTPDQHQGPLVQAPPAQSLTSQAHHPRSALPPQDMHRSSLLSLFKTKSPAAVAAQTIAPSQGSPGPVPSPASVGSHKSSRRPPQRRVSGTQTYGQVENQGNGVSLLGHEGQRKGSGNMSQTDALREAAKENGGPVQMNPEVNLPFRAVNILARPKQSSNSPGAASNTSFPSPKAQPQSVGSPLSNQLGQMGLVPPHRSSPRNMQMKTRPELVSKQSPAQGSQSKYMQQSPIVSPYGSYAGSHVGSSRVGGYTSPATGNSSGPGPSSDSAQPHSAGIRGQQTTTEHKQSLLALFVRGDASSSAGAAGDAGSIGGTPRSHVLSMASSHFGSGNNVSTGLVGAPASHTGSSFGPGSFVGGPPGPGSVASASNMSRQGSHSRKGSQTPISPADREFLLGYLNNKIDRSSGV